MNDDLFVRDGISIPLSELEITSSKSGGPGGQHANKSDTKITIRWNVKNSSVLNGEQKERVLQNLQSRLTSDGDLIIHNSESRSQQQNKKVALGQLVQEIEKALKIPKKRKPTKVTKAAKEARLRKKAQRSATKKLRSKKIED